MSSTLFLVIFASLFATHFIVETVLDVLNLRHLERHQGALPAFAADLVTPQIYQRSIAYTRTKTHFGVVSRIASALFVWVLILSGAFGALDQFLTASIGSESLIRLAYPFAIGFGIYLFQLPFSLYGQFSIEERFGFNKSSLKTFLFDQLKGMVLAVLFGVPLLLLFYWFMDTAGTSWWIFAFIAWMGFQFLTAAIFPVFLAPLFYKFTPLPDSTLSQKIIDIAQRIQFKMAGVFTIDGSRRSSHSNAFFAGLGKTRRVVLFDTLIENLTEDEIVSVVAHEMGHDKLKHIQRTLVLSSLGSLIAFFVLAQALQWPTFFEAFGVASPKNYIGLVLFALFAGVLTFPLQPFFQALSRKNEYAADRFSIETTGETVHMKAALKKLAKDNLSNLTPHPWYSFFHYSHPTLSERLAALGDK